MSASATRSGPLRATSLAGIAPRLALVATLACLLPAIASAAAGAAESSLLDATPNQAKVRIDRIARGTQAYRDTKAKYPDLVLNAIPYGASPQTVEAKYQSGTKKRLSVEIDLRDGKVLHTWRGVQVEWPITRASRDFGRKITRWYIWIPLCLIFLIPFIDPRRPLRLLHLDLLVLVGGFGISQYFFQRGEIQLSTPLVYPMLGYVIVRMLIAGFRPAKRDGPLVPFVPTAALVVAIVALVAFRVGYDVTQSSVADVGFAGVAGADRIEHGKRLYVDSGDFDQHQDSYGPANYLFYVPFETAFPIHAPDPVSGAYDVDREQAARAAAIAFDLLTLLGLFLLGRQLRPGRAGRQLGIVLAFAWASFPYTAFLLGDNFNDGLVAALLVFTLLALSSPPGRGVLLALATAVKLGPLALLPLFARGRDSATQLRDALLCGAAFLVTLALLVGPFLTGKHGAGLFYDQTIGLQLHRSSPFSIWGYYHPPAALGTIAKLAVVGLGIAVAFVPRRRDAVQVAALAAAVIAATQVTASHWFFPFITWFAPFVFVALFCQYDNEQPGDEQRSSAGARRRSRSHGRATKRAIEPAPG